MRTRRVLSIEVQGHDHCDALLESERKLAELNPRQADKVVEKIIGAVGKARAATARLDVRSIHPRYLERD